MRGAERKTPPDIWLCVRWSNFTRLVWVGREEKSEELVLSEPLVSVPAGCVCVCIGEGRGERGCWGGGRCWGCVWQRSPLCRVRRPPARTPRGRVPVGVRPLSCKTLSFSSLARGKRKGKKKKKDEEKEKRETNQQKWHVEIFRKFLYLHINRFALNCNLKFNMKVLLKIRKWISVHLLTELIWEASELQF